MPVVARAALQLIYIYSSDLSKRQGFIRQKAEPVATKVHPRMQKHCKYRTITNKSIDYT